MRYYVPSREDRGLPPEHDSDSESLALEDNEGDDDKKASTTTSGLDALMEDNEGDDASSQVVV